MKELFAPIIRRLTRLEEEMKRPRQGNFSRRGSEVTLAADAFTADHHDHFMLQPESGVSDNLATINGGSDGRRIVLYPKDSGDTITVLASGNIAAARTLDAQTDALELIYSTTLNKWLEPSAATVGGDVATHAALHYVSAHPSPPASNPSGVYYSVMDGIVGGAGVDESNNLLAMFNRIGALGGGKLIIRSVSPSDPIRLDKLVSVYWSNLDIEFRSPVLLGALGGLRIMGELSTFVRAPATNAGKLVSTAAEGTKELLLDTGTGMQASDFLIGDQIIIRGQNDASGNALEKQVANVVAKDTGLNKVTLAQELEYDFEPTYPGSEWPPDLTTGTTIYIVHTVGLSVDAARGDMEAVGVTNFANAEVGTLYRLSDGRNENELNASAIRGSLLPYENDANMEFVRIVATDSGTNTVVFDRAISNDYVSTTPYFAALAKVLPVRNTHIRCVVATHLVDQTSKNAHVLSMGFAQDCSIEYCILNGQITPTTGRRGQAVRIADSYNCWGRYLYIYDPGHWESSEGYGCALYKSTGGGFENCQAWGGRHNFLVQAATFFTLRDCQSWDDHISGFDLHGVNERDGIIENCTGTRSNRSNPTDASNGEVFRYGNTSHTVGCHHITTTGCKVFGPVGANFGAFGILPASTNLKFISCTVDGAYYGIKFTRNSAQCQPVQSVTDVIFQDVHLYNIVSRAVYIQTNPTYDGIATIGKLERVTFKGIITHNCTEHFHVDGQGGVTTLTISECEVASPVTSPANDFYGYNLSGITNLVIRDSSAHLCSRGIRYASCNGVTIVHNTLTATIDILPLVDGGSNTGTILIEANAPLSGTGGTGSQWTNIAAGITYASNQLGAYLSDPTNVAHGMTARAPTDAFARFIPRGTGGGLHIEGLTGADEIGLSLGGTIGNINPTDTTPAILLVGMKKNTTDGQAMAATETVLATDNFGTRLMRLLGSGALSVIGNLTLGSNLTGSPVNYGIGVTDGAAAVNSGNGLNLFVTAGATEAAASKTGGNLTLRAGPPTAPSTAYGNVIIGDSGGLIGMGTGSPSSLYKVDVSGSLNATALYVAGVAVTSSQWAAITGGIAYNGGFVVVGAGTLTGALGEAVLQAQRAVDGTALFERLSADANGPTLELLKRRSGFGAISNGDRLGTIGFSGANTAAARLGASIYAEVDVALSTGDMPSRLILATTPPSSSTPTERMRIGSSGDVIINGDQDKYLIAGRTRIGYGAHSDFAWFSHYDQIDGGDYALGQSALGDTVLNAASGRTIFARIDNNASPNLAALSATNALSVFGAVSETALGSDNVRMGVISGQPEILLENPSSQFGITNDAGILKITNPGVANLLSLTGDGSLTVTNAFSIGGAAIAPQEYGTLKIVTGSIETVQTSSAFNTLVAAGGVTDFCGAWITGEETNSGDEFSVLVALHVSDTKTVYATTGTVRTLTITVTAAGAVTVTKDTGTWNIIFVLKYI